MKEELNMKKHAQWLTLAAIAGSAWMGQAHVSAATYAVQKGDTLFELSQKTGTTVDAWKIANHLPNDQIVTGDTLNQPVSYRVTAGDTLWNLARKYNTTVEDLQRANGLTGSLILIGQVLQIPVDSQGAATVQPAKSETMSSDQESRAKSETTSSDQESREVQTRSDSPVTNAQVVKTLSCVATAYGPSNSTEWGGLTATGKHVAQGMIAVDPKVIPLGSKVWVSGYNDPNLPAGGFMATAEDTGGAIRGNRIDIYINADDATVRNFGMQNVTVKVLQ
jgi:3D (Asp-Asp-Asp) domain-containing protein/LysM repeat protein